MPSTVAEKTLAAASGSDELSPGDHVVCDVDVAMAHDVGTIAAIHRLEEWGIETLEDPSRIVLVMDHIAPSQSEEDANAKARIRSFVDQHGIENYYEVGTGISHEVLRENGHVRPGELVVGRDSHTTSLGAFGAAATGVGGSDIACIFATGENWFRVPETIEISVSGAFPDAVSGKDLMLHLAGTYGADFARYRAIEFEGPAVDALSLDDRITLTNMAVDLGGMFGFTPVDDKVIEYVDERTERGYEIYRADADAQYEKRYEIDVTDLSPKVSKPHEISNVVDVDDVVGVDLDQVFIGSCTNGKFADLEAAATVLDGADVHPSVRLIVTPASREIYSRAEREGLVRVFNDAGAVVTNSTCGACDGRSMGVLGADEVCLAAQNRNYVGRMGSYESAVYLSSPETAAASAIAGHISDPREVRT